MIFENGHNSVGLLYFYKFNSKKSANFGAWQSFHIKKFSFKKFGNTVSSFNLKEKIVQKKFGKISFLNFNLGTQKGQNGFWPGQ